LPIRHLNKVSMMLPHSCSIRLLHRRFPNSASASILPCRFQERNRVFFILQQQNLREEN
jgi:hypothetical protein